MRLRLIIVVALIFLAGCSSPVLPEQEQTTMDVTRVYWTLDITGPEDSYLESNFLHCKTIWFVQDANAGMILTTGDPSHVNFHHLSHWTGPFQAYESEAYHDQGAIRSPVDGHKYTDESGSNVREVIQGGAKFTISESFTTKELQDVRMEIDRRDMPCD
jgi:hypothetical protein